MRGKRELYKVNIGPQMGGGCCNLHVFNYLNSTPKKLKPKNLNTRSYSHIVQCKNVALALTVKSVGGPEYYNLPATGPIGMLQLLRRQARVDVSCNFEGLLGSLQLLLRPGIELELHWPEANALTTTL